YPGSCECRVIDSVITLSLQYRRTPPDRMLRALEFMCYNIYVKVAGARERGRRRRMRPVVAAVSVARGRAAAQILRCMRCAFDSRRADPTALARGHMRLDT